MQQFTDLNFDILLGFFSYLDTESLVAVAQTCKLIHSIAYHPSLWGNYVIRYRADKKLTSETASSLKNRGICVCTAKLPLWGYSTFKRLAGNHQMFNDSQKMWKLKLVGKENMECLASVACNERLSILQATSKYSLFADFPATFHSLVSLDLEDRISISSVDKGGYRNMFERVLSGLENLRVFNCSLSDKRLFAEPSFITKTLADGKYLKIILQSLPKLEDLSIKDFSDSVTMHFDPYVTFPSLKRLSIPGHQRDVFKDDSELLQMTVMFPNLKHLEISSCRLPNIFVGDNHFQYFPQLVSLKIQSPQHNEEEYRLPVSLRGLIALDISAKACDVTASIQQFTNLRVLSLHLNSLHETALDDLQDNILDYLQYLGKLEVLTFSMNDFAQERLHNIVVADRLLTGIERYLPKLISLLGVECLNSPFLPSSVIYVSSDNALSLTTMQRALKIMRKSGDNCWIEVRRGSKAMDEATGNKYFYPTI